MKKALTLPARLTLKTLNGVDQSGLDSSGRKWLKALKLALTRRYTVETIAAKVGRSRPWLFARRDALCRGGLAASLTRQHGGGRKSRFSASVKKEMKKRFRLGDSPAKVHHWLKNEKGIKADIEQVYRLRQRWGLARKQTGRSRRKEPAAPRRDALSVDIDKTTMNKIAFMLNYDPNLPEGLAHKTMGILWILGWRTRMQKELAERKISRPEDNSVLPSLDEVVRLLESSRQHLNKVAQLWTQAKSSWGAFVKSAFGSLNQRNIRNAERAFLNQSPLPELETNIAIKIRDYCVVQFENGKFSKYDTGGVGLDPI